MCIKQEGQLKIAKFYQVIILIYEEKERFFFPILHTNT